MKKLIYLLTLVLVVGCYKDADFFVPDNSGEEQFVKAGFSGLVTDESGVPISGASIAVGTQLTETDINGVYFLDNTTVNIKKAFVTVSKSDYYESSRTLTAKVNTQINLNFILTRKQEIGTFAVAAGGTFSLPDGAVLEVPADGIADPTDEALLYANIWNLNNINISSKMPGDFIGEDENGDEKSLIPYGIFVIASENNTGEALKIADNKSFKISIPLTDNNSPNIVALWLFDEVEGVWKEKGTASVEGQFYVAEVSEFGHWAIADMTEKITISGTISTNSEPVENILVALRNVSTGITRFTYSNSRGAYNFKVPAAALVKVGIFNRTCNEFQESQNITVGTTDIENQDFSSDGGITIFSGESRDCNKEPITNGYVIVADQLVVKLDDNGRFAGTISDCLSRLTVRAFDGNTQEMGISATPEYISPVQVYTVACEGLSEFTSLNYSNRSLLLSEEAVTNLQPVGGDDLGTISLTDETIGTLTFGFKGDSQGSYEVNTLVLNDQLNDKNFEIVEVAMEITLNETVETGETLTGSFAGEFTDIDGATHSLSGSFRVIKDN